MKKSLKVIATATLAFSMFASVAMAAETTPTAVTTTAAVKTSKDFKDLAGLDAALTAKIDALLAKGLFEGTAADSFGIKENMTRAQFAKILALVAGVPVDAAVKTSSFADVKADDTANAWAIPFIEAAKKAGLIDGKSDTSFDPSANVTLGEFATALLKGLGVKPSTTGTPWYADAIKQAVEKKLLAEGTDGSKSATRADLVVGAYSAVEAIANASKPDKYAVAEVKAVGAKKLAVTLNGPVDTAVATFTVTRDGSTATFDAKLTTWDAAKKVATITLDNALIDATYAVTIGGVTVDDAKKTASVVATKEKLTKIEILTASETLPDSDNVLIDFKASNQYGETSSRAASSFTVYAGDVTTTTVSDKQQIKLTNLGSKTKGDKVPVTIIDTDSAIQANKIFTVGEAPLVSKIEVMDLVNSDNVKIESIESGKSAFVQYKAFDQYGVEVTDLAKLNTGGTGVTVVIPDNNLGLSALNTPFVASEVGDSNPDLKLAAIANATAKDITVTFIASGSGQSVTKVIKVATPKVPASVEFGSFTSSLAKGDTNKYIPLVVKNAKGDVLTPDEIVNNADKFTIYATGGVATLAANSVVINGATVSTPIAVTGADKGKIQVSTVDNKGNGQIVVQLKDKPEVKTTFSITANDARYADKLSVSTKAADQLIVAGSNATTSDVKFKSFDQLGGDLKDASVSNATYATFKLEKVSGTTGAITSFTGPGGVNLTTDGQISAPVATSVLFDAAYTWNASASTTGTYKVTAFLYKKNNLGNFVEVSNVSNQVEVVDGKSSNLTYTVALEKAVTGNLLLNTTKYPDAAPSTTIQTANTATIISTYTDLAKKIVVSAKDGDKVVAVPTNAITSIVSSNPLFVEDNDAAYIVGRKAGKATVSVLFSTATGTRSASLDVEVSDNLPTVATLAFKKTSKYVASVNGLNAWDAALAEELKAVDSYGSEYTAATTSTFVASDLGKFKDLLGISFYISDVKLVSGGTGTADTVAIDSSTGAITYTDNGSNNVIGFKLNAVANGKVTTIDVSTN